MDRAEGNDIGAYVDDVIAQIPATGSRLYYHHNHLYSVGALTDSAGVVVERYAYSAYGGRQTVVDDAAVKNEISYTGRRLDPETGLHYFRARYFDAKLGRFVGRDLSAEVKKYSKEAEAKVANYIDGMGLYGAYFVPNHLDPSGNFRVGECYDACESIQNENQKWACKINCSKKFRSIFLNNLGMNNQLCGCEVPGARSPMSGTKPLLPHGGCDAAHVGRSVMKNQHNGTCVRYIVSGVTKEQAACCEGKGCDLHYAFRCHAIQKSTPTGMITIYAWKLWAQQSYHTCEFR